MNDDELRAGLDGLYAYDTGSVDSGIHDEALRARCLAELAARSGPAEIYPRLFIGRMVRDLYLSEEAMAKGYGPEDVASFLEWLSECL